MNFRALGLLLTRFFGKEKIFSKNVEKKEGKSKAM